MSLTSTEPRVRKALDEWRSMSRNGSYMLARMALADACSGYADAHVLMALTDAASRDPRRALEEIAKARAALRDDNARLMTDVPRSRVAAAADRLAAVLEARTLLTPPKDLMEWLERPDLIPSVATTSAPKATPSSAYAGASTNLPPTTARPASVPLAGAPLLPTAASLAMASLPTASSLAPPPLSMAPPVLPQPVLGEMAPLGGVGVPSTPAAPSSQALPGATPARSADSISPEAARAMAAAGIAPPGAVPVRPPMPAPVAPPPPAPAAVAMPWSPAPAPPAPAAPAPPVSSAPPAPAAQPPSPWDDWERRLSAMATAGQLSEAIRQAEEAAAKYPQSARLAEFLAGLHKRAGATERAVETYLAAVERAGKAGHIDRAERAAREAVALSRQSATTLMQVAKVSAAAGVGAVALVALREAASRMAATGERPRLAMVLDFLSKRLPPDAELQREADRLRRDIADAMERGQQVASDTRAVADWTRNELPAPPMIQGGGGSRPPTLQIVGPTPAVGAPPQRVSPPAAGNQRLSRDDAQRRSRAMNAAIPEPAPLPAGSPAPSRGVTTVEAPNSLGYTLAGFSVLALVLAMVTGSAIPGVIGFFISQAVVTAMGTKATDQSSLKAAQFARVVFVIAFFFGWVIP